MKEQEWEAIAKRLLNLEKERSRYFYPKAIKVLVKWRNGVYFGHLQEIAPEYSREIVHLSKTSNPLQEGLAEAIKKLDSERSEFYADESLDLEGRQHILRRLENRLLKMTPEQTKYMHEHPCDIIEF